jgi:hypothetical protein
MKVATIISSEEEVPIIDLDVEVHKVNTDPHVTKTTVLIDVLLAKDIAMIVFHHVKTKGIDPVHLLIMEDTREETKNQE